MNSEFAVYHSHCILLRSYFTGAGSMMTPGLVLDEFLDLFSRTDTLPWYHLFSRHEFRLLHHAPHKFHAVCYRLQVFPVGIIALGEVMEINLRHILGIGRLQPDPSGSVARVSLENGPGEVVL